MKRKGQVSFSNAPNIVIGLVFLGIIAGAGVIALASMKLGVPKDFTPDVSNVSTANTTLINTISSISNFTAQLGTVGTMLGVGLLVAIVLAIFAFGATRRGSGL